MHCFVKQKNPFKTQRGVRSVAMKSFPRTEVAGVSLPRMLMGTNWVYGWSPHRRRRRPQHRAHELE